MQITIEYDSIWKNSFLKSKSNKPFSNENQGGFHASSKVKEQVEMQITRTTVLGILCRLIGDQRKLYQTLDNWDATLHFQVDDVSFEDRPNVVNEEVAFIVNKGNDRPAQTKFLGVIPDDIDLFFSTSAPQLWSVLYLEIEDILDLILSNESSSKKGSSMPRDLLYRIDEIQNIRSEKGAPLITIEREVDNLKRRIEKENSNYLKKEENFFLKTDPTKQQIKSYEKLIDKHDSDINEVENEIRSIENSEQRRKFDNRLLSAVSALAEHFPDHSYIENGRIYRLSLYAASLYIQAERMVSEGEPLDFCIKPNGKIGVQGFSKRGFNGVRDFLNRFAGSKKKTVGTPYNLSKASGTLEIYLDIDRDKAKELKQLIDFAGVSSFYLGKKGLAYVTDIDTREVSH